MADIADGSRFTSLPPSSVVNDISQFIQLIIISRGDPLMASEATVLDPEQRPHPHAADGGLPGPALDALQGVRPQQHHQPPDRGVQVGRGEPVHDGQVQRDRLFEQDPGLFPPVQPRLQRAARPDALGGDRGRGGEPQAAGASASAATATRRTSAWASSSTPAGATCRCVYIIEDNGCYGLTKGQFSATADLHAHLRRETGEENTIPPFDLCLEAIAAGASFVARSFAGDKKQMRPAAEGRAEAQGAGGARHHQPVRHVQRLRRARPRAGTGPREHEEPLQEVGFVPRLPEIEVEQKAGETTRVQLHDGSWITLRALRHDEHKVTDRGSALRLLVESQERDEFLTGLIYVAPERPDFVTLQEMTDTPLALLPDEALRPVARRCSTKIMETI